MEERVHHGHCAEFLPSLKVFAEQPTAARLLCGRDDECVPEVDLGTVTPMPGALNHCVMGRFGIPFHKVIDGGARVGEWGAALSGGVRVELEYDLPT